MVLLKCQSELTIEGSIGASHICPPSVVSLIPSISLSGVRTSLVIFSNTFTLSGYAEISANIQTLLKMLAQLLSLDLFIRF